MEDTRIILAIHQEVILVLWPTNNCKYVTAMINETDNYKVGDSVRRDWYNGHYFLDLQSAILDYLERAQIIQDLRGMSEIIEKILAGEEEEKEKQIPETDYLRLAATAVVELKNSSDWESRQYTYGYLLENVLKLTEDEAFEA